MRDIKYINLKDNSIIDPRYKDIKVVQGNTNVYWLGKDSRQGISEIVFALYDTVYVLADIDDEDDLIVNGYGLHLGDNFEIREWVWDSYGGADFCYQYLETEIIENGKSIGTAFGDMVDKTWQNIKKEIPQETIDKVLKDAEIEIKKYNYIYDMVCNKCDYESHGYGDTYYLTLKNKSEDSTIDSIEFKLEIYGNLYEETHFKAKVNCKDGSSDTDYIEREYLDIIDGDLYEIGIDLDELIKDYDFKLY